MHFAKIAFGAGLLQGACAAVIPQKGDILQALRYAELTPEERELPVYCAPNLQVIAVRGTYQPESYNAGEGSLGDLSQSITESIPGSSSLGLVYDASMTPNYQTSERKGHQNMTQYIRFFTARCPDTKLSLLGYSQGAQVIMDALGGATEGGKFPYSSGLKERWQQNIQSIVLWGDPTKTFSENAHYNFGTSKKDGVFPRENQYLMPYRDMIASFCDSGDPYCDSGNDADVHLSYPYVYAQQSLEWVQKMYYSNAQVKTMLNGKSDEKFGF